MEMPAHDLASVGKRHFVHSAHLILNAAFLAAGRINAPFVAPLNEKLKIALAVLQHVKNSPETLVKVHFLDVGHVFAD
jgi:hypothetical protein